MAKKQMAWKTKGMNRDMSVSTFSPEFSFENMNLRLNDSEGNTLLSWVSEKGTKKIEITSVQDISGSTENINQQDLEGFVLGTATINHKLVLFTHTFRNEDYIYVLEFTANNKDTMSATLLFKGNLNFDLKHPIETLVSYESDSIQKVYWTDGLNQPRVINVANTDPNYNHLKRCSFEDGDKKYNSCFDFIPALQGKEKVGITKKTVGGGLFSPGVIQYAFNYTNNYGQQSNLVYISPLYYIALEDRANSPEETVSNTFNIIIEDFDKSFDNIRLYSIHRSSWNAVPNVKVLTTIPLEGAVLTEYFSKQLVYSTDNNLTLPRDSQGKIKTLSIINGSYSTSITYDGISGKNTSIFKLVGYNIGDNNDVEDTVELLSLQDLLDAIAVASIDNVSYDIKECYVSYTIVDTLNNHLLELAQSKGCNNWGIDIAGALFKGDTNKGLAGTTFVYNYDDESWYFNVTNVTEKITENDPKKVSKISFTDTGTVGYTVDSTELLYIGGKEIVASTIKDKDAKLFLGNIQEKTKSIVPLQQYFDGNRNSENPIKIVFSNTDDYKKLSLDSVKGVYGYTNTLKWEQDKITTFKGGEIYRFGIQLQDNLGVWSEPILIGDFENTIYPKVNIHSDTINLVNARVNIPLNKITATTGFSFSDYKKIRPIVVYPNIGDRKVICQGVLNPTVFNIRDRVDKVPYAQASWFFRPYMVNDYNTTSIISEEETPSTGNILISEVEFDPETSSTVDLSIDDYFSRNANVKQVYVLVADLPVDTDEVETNWRYQHPFKEGIRKHRIVYSIEQKYKDRAGLENLQYPYISYLGYIQLGEGDDIVEYEKTIKTNRYAFLSDKPFPLPHDWTTVDAVNKLQQRLQYTNIQYIATSYHTTEEESKAVSFSWYDKMLADDKKFYYVKPTGGPDSFVFKFYARDIRDGYDYSYYFTVTFEADSNDIYYPNPSNTVGASLVFNHYSSINAQNDIENGRKKYSKLAAQIEIQGSRDVYNPKYLASTKKYYSGVYNSYNDSVDAVGNNSQFFVDQSIVTLNSPDLEFDTEVQNYTMKGLQLRIVGAIPITANASAHHIVSGNLLNTGYNTSYPGTNTGRGEINTNIVHNNIDINAGRRLVSGLLWNDVAFKPLSGDKKFTTTKETHNFYVYPWNRQGSLSNDNRGNESASLLKTKKISHLLYSKGTEYFNFKFENNENIIPNLDCAVALQENEHVYSIRLDKQKSTSSEINYFPNIDTAIIRPTPFKVLGSSPTPPFTDGFEQTLAVPMSYKSGTHAVLAFKASGEDDIQPIPILPYVQENYTGLFNNPGSIEDENRALFNTTFWGDTYMWFSQTGLSVSSLFKRESNGVNAHVPYNILWIGELYRTDVVNQFGGDSREAIQSNVWLIAGDSIPIEGKSDVDVYWNTGDTYYQRYDCLKTCGFTDESVNQNIEILSFMCETHVNIDGRYDKHRGQQDSTYITPSIFNRHNSVYNQQNNFFNYQVLNLVDSKYPNHIAFTKTKNSGADVDLWTNITLANSVELDGDKGEITSLRKLNDQLIAFQKKGISQVLYNENVQISSTAGVPIEIANSNTVQGVRYISNTIGCSDKWSIVNTPSGIYFMDSIGKSIYLYNGQLQNISDAGGFNAWCKENINTEDKWSPFSFKGFKSHYDPVNQEVLFTNKTISLAYSEKLNSFTSFYNYGNTPYFCNLEGENIWVTKAGVLWKHHAGEPCNFFGINKPYWMTVIGNQEPITDKTFTNLEFRANIEGEGTYDETTGKFIPYIPFDSIEVWNEYQHGYSNLENKYSAIHHKGDTSALNRKFRMWRCDIPRDNAPLDKDKNLNITRFKVRPLDRMRNPWLYIKLGRGAAASGITLPKVEIHDVILTYFA